MKYETQRLSIEEAKSSIDQYTYGLVYLFGEILLGITEEIKDRINWNECIEARFFSNDKELHLFDYNGEQRAILVKDVEEADEEYEIIDKKCPLARQFQNYEQYKIRQYISYDEDGQAFVELTRLVELTERG